MRRIHRDGIPGGETRNERNQGNVVILILYEDLVLIHLQILQYCNRYAVLGSKDGFIIRNEVLPVLWAAW